MRDYNKELEISWTVLAIGIILDMITTIVGIAFFCMGEANILGLRYILIVNIILLITIYFVCTLKIQPKYIKTLSLFILLIGLFRIVIAIYNITLILRFIY